MIMVVTGCIGIGIGIGSMSRVDDNALVPAGVFEKEGGYVLFERLTEFESPSKGGGCGVRSVAFGNVQGLSGFVHSKYGMSGAGDVAGMVDDELLHFGYGHGKLVGKLVQSNGGIGLQIKDINVLTNLIPQGMNVRIEVQVIGHMLLNDLLQ